MPRRNQLLPIREQVVTTLFYAAATALFPGVNVKAPAALETLRGVRNVVSDKTGTLTADTMGYRWPIANPAWEDEHGLGTAVLLCCNDSKANPLWQGGVHDGDGGSQDAGTPPSGARVRPHPLVRLLQSAVTGALGTDVFASRATPLDHTLRATPTLCTSSEEGAIYFALTHPPARRIACTHTALPPERGRELFRGEDAWWSVAYVPVVTAVSGLDIAVWRGEPSGELLRAVWHHRGGFVRDFRARLSVVSLLTRPDGDSYALTAADRDPATSFEHLCARGWVRVGGPLIVVQGGGDVVAAACGTAAARWEQELLRAMPDRTLSHAIAPAPAEAGLVDATGVPQPVDAAVVHGWHRAYVARAVRSRAPSTEEAAGMATSGVLPTPGYQLTHLSKFDNPVVAGGESLFARLRSHGVRLHVCTGDTFLTARAVLADMAMLPAKSGTDPAAVQEVLWDWAPPPEPIPLPAVRDLVGAAASHAATRFVVFCSEATLLALDAACTEGVAEVVSATGCANVTFAFYRVSERNKPRALRLLSLHEEVRVCAWVVGEGGGGGGGRHSAVGHVHARRRGPCSWATGPTMRPHCKSPSTASPWRTGPRLPAAPAISR
jgi:hypothetical protein